MSLVKFRCLDGSNDISAAPFEDGSIIFDIATKDIYLDYGDKRVKLTEDKSYPAGSIYMTYESSGKSPAEMFGGTWQRLPEGVLYTADSYSTWDFRTDGVAIAQNTRSVTQIVGWYRVS